MNRYEEQRFRHQNEFNTFPIMYAFSNEQFDKGMIKLGLNPEDIVKNKNLINGLDNALKEINGR